MATEIIAHSLKRNHSSFQQDNKPKSQELEAPFSVPPGFIAGDTQFVPVEHQLDSTPLDVDLGRESSVARSTTGSLTDAASATPSRDPSPAIDATAGEPLAVGVMGGLTPLAKKAKLTFQEKEMKRINKENMAREKTAERMRKDAERQAYAEQKAKKEAEREMGRKKKEAEREEKRAAQEAEKAAREERRKKKEEEKAKKDKGQMKLGNFFTIPKDTRPRATSVDSKARISTSPAPQSSALSVAVASPMKTPSKPATPKTPYERLFMDFYVNAGVTVAPINQFERDDEAKKAAESTIDAYILGSRSPGRQRTFDASSLFHVSFRASRSRGRRYTPVRELMSEASNSDSSKHIDLTIDSQNSQIKRTHDLLTMIPMKFLQFQEDVRPPYRGTYTSRPVTGMKKLARNPLRRDLPDTNYDYDSEAEWVEDEDAEDLKSEGDEEEELDDDEDMDGFLDDENDETASARRLILQGDLEPISTGLCWENTEQRNSNVKMMPYRMETILDSSLVTIDPFSTSYWASPLTTSTSMDPPRIPLKCTSSNIAIPSAKPVKSFFSAASDINTEPGSHSPPEAPKPRGPKPRDPTLDKPKKTLPEADLAAFKAAVEGSDLSKIGLIEVLKKKFPGRPAAAIKGTLELVARREGKKEVEKRWVLN
ncbi:chromatin assembly factor 1 subunit A [Diplocarpon rosae]|nr:chromatin assembly factor 1 subunit A [Diplocarpon rosae]